MKTMQLGGTGPHVPVIGLGMMRLPTCPNPEAFLRKALDGGWTFFDHADIYGGGKSEALFGQIMSSVPRDQYVVQSKCGIRKGWYDLSTEHILSSVDASLSRLKTDYLDLLLLHRPDALMEPAEIASAFDRLHATGKVRAFGVSNMNPLQMELLQKQLSHPLAVNQLQMSLCHCPTVDQGICANTMLDGALMRDGSCLDWCRLHGVSIQAWSPFQHGFFKGVFLGNPDFPALNTALHEVGEQYRVSDTAVALAWLLRHPAGIQPIVGTTNPDRLPALAEAVSFTLDRESWYKLYRAAGKELP